VAHEAQLAGGLAFLIQARIGIGGGRVSIVTALLAFEVACVIVTALFEGETLVTSPSLNQRAVHAEVLARDPFILVGNGQVQIEPGSPTQNAYIESFNGTFRDECLDENWFESLAQARGIIAAWRTEYNEIRPHSSCGRMPPATFAALNRQLTGDSGHPSRSDEGVS